MDDENYTEYPRIPRVTTDYGRCGPDMGFGPKNSGPRCKRCKAKIKETGKNHYCGTLVPLAQTTW